MGVVVVVGEEAAEEVVVAAAAAEVEAAQVEGALAVTLLSVEAPQPIPQCTDGQATPDQDQDPAPITEEQSMGAINIDIPAPKFTSMIHTQILLI